MYHIPYLQQSTTAQADNSVSTTYTNNTTNSNNATDLSAYCYDPNDYLDINNIEPSLFSNSPTTHQQFSACPSTPTTTCATYNNFNNPQHHTHQNNSNVFYDHSTTPTNHSSWNTPSTPINYHHHPHHQTNNHNNNNINTNMTMNNINNVNTNNTTTKNSSKSSTSTKSNGDQQLTDTSKTAGNKTSSSSRSVRKRKAKKDPNEPQKPVSAYALFFRDTQAAIKGRTPNATFGEVSKIVASMWDALDGCAKNSYKQKTESAKREYLKRLAAYRASQISQDNANGCNGLENANAVVQRDTTPRYYEPQSVPNATNPTQIGDVSLANLIALPPVKQQPYNPGTPAFTVGVRNDYVASEWNNARCSMLQQPPQMTANFV